MSIYYYVFNNTGLLCYYVYLLYFKFSINKKFFVFVFIESTCLTSNPGHLLDNCFGTLFPICNNSTYLIRGTGRIKIDIMYKAISAEMTCSKFSNICYYYYLYYFLVWTVLIFSFTQY